MLKATELKGCYVAIITPMKEVFGEYVIDFDHFYKQIQNVVDAGCAGIVIAGTTGQSATLSHSEQIELVTRGSIHGRLYAEKKGRKIQVIGSAGSNCTRESIHLMQSIDREARVDAYLHVTGYYNNPPQEGLLRHYLKVADEAARHDTSIILYNVPSRTKSNIEAVTCIELAKHPAVIAVKEASGDIEQIQVILDGTDREEFTVVSGEDNMVAEIMKRGGNGVISATANRWPKEFQILTELALAGEHDKAAELQQALLPCCEATFCAKNPIPLHEMLGSQLRLPLVTLDKINIKDREKALSVIEKAEALSSFPHVG
jgi:4-hydroxy-tetrahydrodipicolinate synthase